MKLPKSTDRLGWREYYRRRFNTTQDPQAAVMAMWYDFLLLFYGEHDEHDTTAPSAPPLHKRTR